jgi:hypothetical protein
MILVKGLPPKPSSLHVNARSLNPRPAFANDLPETNAKKKRHTKKRQLRGRKLMLNILHE